MAQDETFEYEIALSFAGEDRAAAQSLADQLIESGIRVFYDLYEQSDLWGKDLYQHLQEVYREKAQYCVIFVSKSYSEKLWTKHELKQAQARAFRENSDYILPLRLDDTEIPGLNHTVGYIDLRQNSIEQVAQLIVRKLNGTPFPDGELDWNGEFVTYNGQKVASYWPKKLEAAQSLHIVSVSKRFERIRYGSEDEDWGADHGPCHDCAALKGQYHVPGCDVERCPQCDGQLIFCDCDIEFPDQA